MARILSWIGTLSFLLVGIEAVFMAGNTEHLLSRVLVAVAVVSSSIAARLRSTKETDFDRKPTQGAAIEIMAIVTLIGGAGMMYIVFIAPESATYRRSVLIISTIIAVAGVVSGEILRRSRH